MGYGPSPLPPATCHSPSPRFHVLLKAFLRFEAVGHDDNRSIWKNMPEQRREKRLRGPAHARAGQHASLLQAPRQGSHSGSLRNFSEQTACRSDLLSFAPSTKNVAVEVARVKKSALIL